ncbi:hypothetical protein FACS1894166_03860 [Bacilli bacterium]|nr:hypothetical protein FACS1894166_03860 [Bacilli bacterium]
MHHKALIIDNSAAIYGGSNIGNEYLAINPNKYYWRDMNMVLKGEIVNSLNIEFINDWMTFTNKSITKASKDNLINNLDE